MPKCYDDQLSHEAIKEYRMMPRTNYRSTDDNSQQHQQLYQQPAPAAALLVVVLLMGRL